MVFDFEPSSGLPVDLPVDRAAATACVGIGGMIYSNFRESRVNVTGPYVAKSEQGKALLGTYVTSLVKLTFIMAPNFPSVSQLTSETFVVPGQ